MIKKRKLSTTQWFVLLAMMVAFALVLRSCLPKDAHISNNVVSVTTATVTKKDVTLMAHAIGNVQPYVSVSVKARVEGQILSVGFKEGENVTQGQTLFEIDPHPYQVALEQAKANLARDQAQLENLQKQLVRYDQLVKKGYISKQDFDATEANLKAQAATVMADKALVSNAELNLSYCTMKAPISGRTGSLLVQQGNLVKANESSPLVVINQMKPIYVSFALPEHQLAAVKNATAKGSIFAAIQTKNSNIKRIAKLSFIDNSVDKNTGMIQLKALFPNEHEEIWPGQYVDVTLPITNIKNALLLPTRTIQEGPEGSYVFVVNKDRQVKQKNITLGDVIDEDTIVKDLPMGTMVVATGQSQLVDGSKVQVTSSDSQNSPPNDSQS